MKMLLALVFIGSLALASNANAQYLTGTLSGEALPPYSYGYLTSSSIEESDSNIVQSATGNFAGIVPINSISQAFVTISGLSTTPIPVLNTILIFSEPDEYPGYQASGTTPSDRFIFKLQTLAEDSYDSGTGAALFTGTGTIVDLTGAYQDTSADLTVTFSGGPNKPYSAYTFEVETVPEPGAMSFAAASLLCLLVMRRRLILTD
ncbi:MAG TPA: hypothetical protein VH280_08825 [Verrucomicrobiae bacterium]|jgi:hypothetical protein|nr:hypothetical protein [Verrucomicrobiae bacterium]